MIPGSWSAAGTPVSEMASKTCVGSYVGKVLYPDNPDSIGFSGYIATATAVSAQDIQRTTTTNVAGGVGGDQKCGKSGSVSFNQIDGYYAFTIYFPSGTTVPSGRYTNKLTNFNP
jgi:hypothetical protein